MLQFALAVAGGLADDEVGELEVRTGVGQRKAIARLDERTQIAGQMSLGCRDGSSVNAHRPIGMAPAA